MILIYAMVGISLVVLTGWSGNVSLGQWAIVGVGALVTAKLATQEAPLDFFIILLVAGLCGAAVSLVIGLPALRIRGLFLGATTLAFALAAFNWIFHWSFLIDRRADAASADLRRSGTQRRRRRSTTSASRACSSSLWLGRNLRRSRWGRNLVAVRDNEAQAAALGMRLTDAPAGGVRHLGVPRGVRRRRSTRTTSRRSAPTGSIRRRRSLMFSMVVIGGMGSLTGAVLGAVYVRGIQYFLPAELQLFATGFGLLILLLVFPGGLGQIFFAMRDRMLREIAQREGFRRPEPDRRQAADRAGPRAGRSARTG